MVTQTIICYHCGSPDLIRDGHQNGRQRCLCSGSKTSRQNKGSNAYDPAHKAEILGAYNERGSMRAMTRIFAVSRHTIRRYREEIGLALYPKPNLSRPSRVDHRVYPYLLRGLSIERPDQV